MLQLENHSPFVPELSVLPDVHGIDTVFVVVKATFTTGGGVARVADEQQPVVLADEYWGEPGRSSLRRAGEAHLGKPATDVVVLGDAWAPAGHPVPWFGVSLCVGRLRKIAHVWGDRVWRRGAFGLEPSPPATVRRVPLVYERAVAGVDNPVGCPPRGRRADGELVGRPLANLEDPGGGVAGFGFVAPSWAPRARHAGTYDAAWQAHRAPYLPADFDPRFFQAAPAGLVWPGHVDGPLPVELVNLSPRGVERFTLPACRWQVSARLAGRQHTLPMQLETVLLEPGEARLSLTYRGALACDKQVLRLERVRVGLEGVQT
jgi:hypothetical protein